MKIKISYIKLETYIFKHNGSKNRSIHFFHEIQRVDDQRPKTPLILNMYIKLVHNPGRDDCTCMSFKIKEKRRKKPKTTGTSMKKQIKINSKEIDFTWVRPE